MGLTCAATLSMFLATVGAGQDLSLRDLNVGQQLEVCTEARIYRLTVVDPSTGETTAAVSTDGVDFSRPAKVYFLGATQGRQPAGGEMMVLMGQIKPGLRVELGLGSLSRFDRALTEPVTQVRVIPTSTH